MQKPTSQRYGLSERDVANVVQYEKRFSWWMAVAGAAIGAPSGFFLLRFLSESVGGGIGGALFFALFGYMNIPDWTEPIAARLNSRVRRYAQFKSALRTFENWDVRTRTEFWQSLSGRAFEHELAALFRQEGYDVTVTRFSGDKGIDIFLRRGGRTTAVQCKRKKHPVGPAVARELYGAMIAAEADDGILAAVGGVTPGVHDFFRGKPLRVMDLYEIMSLHEKH